jgi:hypothetical protein
LAVVDAGLRLSAQCGGTVMMMKLVGNIDDNPS